jgi:hypothetical protein
MGAARHNPSRRAVLGATVALPVAGFTRHCEERSDATIQPALESGLLRSARNDGRAWDRALAAYRAAEAELRRYEWVTSGAPWETQRAVEQGYGERLGAHFAALRRLMRLRAPDVGALAVKIELAVDHEVGTLTGGEACLATLKRDARRLAGW